MGAGEAVVNVLLSLVLGPFLIGGATIAHKQEPLCQAMGGTWTPQGGNVCPGGSLYKFVFEQRQQPKK